MNVLGQATQFTGEWLLRWFGVFFAFAFAYAAARFVAIGAFRVGYVAVEIVALALLATATAVAVWATFGPERERRLGKLGRMEALGVALAAVPLLDIPETLRWSKPYEYSDGLSGWLLLLFKAFVIFPLVQAVRLILARRGAGRPARSRRGAARQVPR